MFFMGGDVAKKWYKLGKKNLPVEDLVYLLNTCIPFVDKDLTVIAVTCNH